MRHAAINFSTVVEYDRLDAEFHLAIDELDVLKKGKEFLENKIDSIRDVIGDLKANYDIDQMREKLSTIRDEDKKSAAIILGRGTSKQKKAKYAAICDEYPYIAFVLISRDIDSAIERVKDAIKNEKDYLKNLTELGAIKKSKHEDPDPSNS